MPTYYAIAHHQGEWTYLCAGRVPEDVYWEALTLIEARERYADEDGVVLLSPNTESLLDTLRVVPEETAREHYHVVFPRHAQVE